jgi:hypothetical protein
VVIRCQEGVAPSSSEGNAGQLPLRRSGEGAASPEIHKRRQLFTASIKAQPLHDIHVKRRFHLILKCGDRRFLLWRIAWVFIALNKWRAMARACHGSNLWALSTRIKRR